jgi:hypothetical protein
VLRVPTRKPIALDFPHHSLVVAHIRTDEGVTEGMSAQWS